MSTTNNTTDSKDQQVVCNLISQRNRFLSLLTPPIRYTPQSPYPDYTRQQIDMRRKAEILQYKNNSSQVSQQTKTQKWSQIATASTNRIVSCNKDPYVSSPSSACYVPGTLVYLYYDPKVPLYNYKTNQDSYAKFYTSVPNTWKFFIDSDISGGSMIPTLEHTNEPQEGEEGYEVIEYQATENILIGTLMIQEIRDPMTSYKFVIPIGLFATARTTNVSTTNPHIIQITSAKLNIYFYNDTVAINPTTPPLIS